MESVQIDRYGDASCLSVRSVEPAAPGPSEVRVRVRAASVNAADLHMLHGTPLPLRLAVGFSRPHRIRGFGADVAGVVESVGAQVTRLRVGDEVFGDLSGCGFGAASTLVTAPESALVHKPRRLTFEQAAAVPMAAATALNGLCGVAGLAQGQRLLVVGATGGVGSFAMQLGASMGAEVTALARAEKRAALEALEVGRVVDSEALGRGELGTFDVVLDAAAFGSPFAYRAHLVPGGVYVLAGGSFGALLTVGLFGGLARLVTGRRFRTYVSTPKVEDLETLARLCDEGRLRPLVDRVFPLREAAAAVARLERREAVGKVVLSVEG